jgi:hypothetical protein
MRKLVLLLVIAALLSRSIGNRILQVTIVVPPNLISYYEWLTDLPWQGSAPEKPDPFENKIEYGQYHPLPNKNSISSIYGA